MQSPSLEEVFLNLRAKQKDLPMKAASLRAKQMSLEKAKMRLKKRKKKKKKKLES